MAKKPGGKLFAAVNSTNKDIGEFQQHVRTKAAKIWPHDDNRVYIGSFGEFPFCQTEVKNAVRGSARLKANFEPEASLSENAVHEQLKR